MFKKWFGGGKKDSPKRRIASVNLDLRPDAKRLQLPPKFAQSVIESEIEVDLPDATP